MGVGRNLPIRAREVHYKEGGSGMGVGRNLPTRAREVHCTQTKSQFRC
jgi:hypothetical protein